MGAGASLGAFFGGLQDTIGKKLEQQHAEGEKLKAEKRDMYQKVIFDPNSTESGRATAWQELQKLYNPEAKKTLSKIAPALGKVFGHKQGLGGQPSPQGAPQGAPQGPATAPAAGQAPSAWSEQLPPGVSAPGSPQGPQIPQPPQNPRQQFNQGPDLAGMFNGYGTEADNAQWSKKLERARTVLGPNASLNDVAMLAYTGKPPVERPRTSDNVVRPGLDPDTGKPYAGSWRRVSYADGRPDEWEKKADKPTTQQIRSLPHAVSAITAKQLAANGATFADENGGQIDPSKLPPGTALQGVMYGDKLFYVPVSQNQTHLTVGNQVLAVGNLDQMEIPNGAGKVLGQARTPTSRTTEQPAVNPVTREMTWNTVQSSSSPVTTGVAGATRSGAPGQQPSGPVPSPGSRKPVQANPSSNAAPAPPARAPGGGSQFNGLPLAEADKQRQMVIPVSEAVTNVLGDPRNPDVKGLRDFHQLANDPEASKRIGVALNIIFGGMEDASNGASAHLDGSVGPVSIGTGGFGNLLQNALGVPQKVAEQQSRIATETLQKLKPEEREYVNSVISSFSSIVGLRSLTKASAAQSTVKALERDIPLIGRNVTSSSDYADKLQHITELARNGARYLPKVGGQSMLDSELSKRLNEAPGELEKIKKSAGPAKAPPATGSKSPKKGDKQTYQGVTYNFDGSIWKKVA